MATKAEFAERRRVGGISHFNSTKNNRRWDDPELWKGVKVGECDGCGLIHVTRNGLCGPCEHLAALEKACDQSNDPADD